MIPQRISFARTLPILALLLSYVIIAVPATMAYVNFRRAARHGNDVIVRYNKDRFRVSHAHFLRTAIEGSAALTSPALVAINSSGAFIEFLVQKTTGTWPHGWSPRGIPVWAWKAFAFPVYCLPFWVLVGLGMDALFRERRLRWWALVSGSLLWTLYLFVVVALIVNVLVAKDRYPIALAYAAGLWFVLLAPFPVAWIKQTLTWRQTRTSLHARLFAGPQ